MLHREHGAMFARIGTLRIFTPERALEKAQS